MWDRILNISLLQRPLSSFKWPWKNEINIWCKCFLPVKGDKNVPKPRNKSSIEYRNILFISSSVFMIPCHLTGQSLWMPPKSFNSVQPWALTQDTCSKCVHLLNQRDCFPHHTVICQVKHWAIYQQRSFTDTGVMFKFHCNKRPKKHLENVEKSNVPHPWSKRWSCTLQLRRWSPPGCWGWG